MTRAIALLRSPGRLHCSGSVGDTLLHRRDLLSKVCRHQQRRGDMTYGDEAALVAAAAAGRPLAQVAAAAGVSMSTVQRRLRDPEVARAVAVARSELRRQAVARLVDLRASALNRVEAILELADPALALRAATLILNMSLKVEAAYDFHDRLAALEEGLVEEEDEVDDEVTREPEGAPVVVPSVGGSCAEGGAA